MHSDNFERNPNVNSEDLSHLAANQLDETLCTDIYSPDFSDIHALSQQVRDNNKQNDEKSNSDNDDIITIYYNTSGKLIIDTAITCINELGKMGNVYRHHGLGMVRTVKKNKDINKYKENVKISKFVMEPMTILTLRSEIYKKIDFRKSKKDADVSILPPKELCEHILALPYAELNLPELQGIISAPIFRYDLTLLTDAGYDEKTKLFANFDAMGGSFSLAPMDIEEAKEIIEDCIAEFPFANDVAKACAISMLLTILVYNSLPACPIFAITADSPGTGKTALAECIHILLCGTRASAITFDADEESFRKKIFSALLEGQKVILIDNVPNARPINSSLLACLLSSQSFSDRILGKNSIVSVDTDIMLLITGNHLTLCDDMIRRSLLIELHRDEERPQDHVFKKDLFSWVMQNRIKILSACITILQAYIDAGQPVPDGVVPLQTFAPWSTLVRNCTIWLGYADPVQSQRAMESSDTTRITFMQICSLWRQIYGEKAIKISTLLQLDRDNDQESELFHALESVCPKKISSSSISSWIRRYKNRNIGGYKIVEAEYREHNTALWRVVVTEAAEAVNQDNYDMQSNATATSASKTLTFFLNDVDFDDDEDEE